MDFDVVGLGGWRREEIKRQRAPELGQTLILTVHKGGPFDESLFAAALETTMEWLRPNEVRYQIWPLSQWQKQLLEIAQKTFTAAFATNQNEMIRLIQDYNQEKPLTDWLLLEHFCYLPIFAHQKKVAPELEQILKFEVNRALMEIRDFGKKKISPGRIMANETIDVSRNESHVFILYVDPQTLQVITSTLKVDEAHILDLLDEGLDLDIPQLLQLILGFEWGEKKSPQEWAEFLDQMINKGLILTAST